MSEAGSSTDGLAAELAEVARNGATAVDAALAFAEADPQNSRERTLVWQDPVPTAAAGATMNGIEYMEAIVGWQGPAAADRGDDALAADRAGRGALCLRGGTGRGAPVAVRESPRTPGGTGHTSRGVVLSRPNGSAIRPPCVLPPLGPALASRTRGHPDGH